MCGIAGLLSFQPQGAPVDAACLRRMGDAMRTRGPDGEGFWLSSSGAVGLAHRRLAIIDPTPAGAQPFASADGGLIVSFNGEIYNHRELRGALEQCGEVFRSGTDTEVLLHLYRREGPGMVSRLRGMFAFAIWDEAAGTLFLARDAFGIKPLYLAEGPSGLAFASQVKALAAGGFGHGGDPAALVGFLILGFVPEPLSWRAGVMALPAGCTLLVDRQGRRTLSRHADPKEALLSAAPRPPDLGAFQSALADSVRYHFVADVPVGVFLSAGLDSGALMTHAHAVAGRGVPAITLGFREFAGRPEDEAPLAAMVAARCGADQAVALVSPEDFQAAEDGFLAAMDQPSLDGANTYLVSAAAAARGWKVALSGLGGDELLGGYPSFSQVPRLARALAPLAAAPGLGRAARAAMAPLLARTAAPKWAGILEYGTSIPDAWLLRRAVHMPWELGDLIPPELAREGLTGLALRDRLAETVAGVAAPHLQVMLLEIGWYMRGQLLRDTDWAGMAHGLEIRTPLVDLHLFRALAPFLVGPQRLDKRHMARGLEPALPQELLTRAKTGFTVPLRRWAGVRTNSRDGRRGWASRLLRRHWGARFGLPDRMATLNADRE